MLLLLAALGVAAARAGRVLLVSPAARSELPDSLVHSLLQADHEVTYVTAHVGEPRPNLQYVDVSSVLEQIRDEKTNEELPEDVSSARYLPLLGARSAARVLQHRAVRGLLLNTSLEFDAVLVEWLYTGLLAPLGAVFECPVILYSPTGVSWQSLSLVSDVPARRLHDEPTALVDRLRRMCSQIYLSAWNYFYISRIEIPAYEKTYRQAFQERRRSLPNYESAVTAGSLLLVNSHPLLSAPLALPANVDYVGGLHIPADVPPLPKNLKKVLDGSAAGVIYVHIDTSFIPSDVENRIVRELKEAFAELEQTIIWKYDDILVTLPHNIYTVKNPPQHSILDHKNTIAFLNNGDMMSMLDATHHGVPVVALPLLEDQDTNAHLMSKRGCGVVVDNKNLAWEVKIAVKAILNNSSYHLNAKKIKSTFREHVATPQRKFIHWVELVIKTQGAHHLRSPTLRTAALEKYNIDLLLLVLMIFWFLTKVRKVVRVHLDSTNDEHEKED